MSEEGFFFNSDMLAFVAFAVLPECYPSRPDQAPQVNARFQCLDVFPADHFNLPV